MGPENMALGDQLKRMGDELICAGRAGRQFLDATMKAQAGLIQGFGISQNIGIVGGQDDLVDSFRGEQLTELDLNQAVFIAGKRFDVFPYHTLAAGSTGQETGYLVCHEPIPYTLCLMTS